MRWRRYEGEGGVEEGAVETGEGNVFALAEWERLIMVGNEISTSDACVDLLCFRDCPGLRGGGDRGGQRCGVEILVW